MATNHKNKQRRDNNKDRGWLADLLLFFPELIVGLFKWLIRGISAFFRHWS
ncbi:hypothetical protein [Lentibacillus amyloliquefaciens]|uniref:hypothetical protein n=1 Tax=Lentibacillus amyloliquefaciens TaxID=1472767 RepID=UPI0012E38B1A|nr:hypothetical protein [Lentibacillus amyloliquefaciens]